MNDIDGPLFSSAEHRRRIYREREREREEKRTWDCVECWWWPDRDVEHFPFEGSLSIAEDSVQIDHRVSMVNEWLSSLDSDKHQHNPIPVRTILNAKRSSWRPLLRKARTNHRLSFLSSFFFFQLLNEESPEIEHEQSSGIHPTSHLKVIGFNQMIVQLMITNENSMK